MRAARYLRISQDREGKRLGVDRQREHSQGLEARLGVTHVIEFCDNDKSASTLSKKKRPDFERMVAMAERGEFDVLVAYSTSRLTRRPMEIERIIPLGERHGVKIHTVKHGDYDLNSARGRRRAREDAARDAEEVEETAERIRDEVLQRAAQGRHHGGPSGYGFDGSTINEAEAEHIRAWAARILAGGSVRGIVSDLTSRGVPAPNGGTTWRPTVVRKILLKPRIAGLRILHGTEYPAVNPHIVEPDTWRAVVRILTAPERLTSGGSTARKHIGTGLFICERCTPGTVNTAYNRHGGRLYQCLRCWRSWLAAPIEEWLEKRVVQPRFARDDATDLLARPSGVDTEALHTEKAGKRGRLNELAEQFADEQIDAEQLRIATQRIRERLAEIDEALAGAGLTDPLAPIVLADNPVAAYKAITDLDRRRAVYQRLMTVVLGPPMRGRAKFDPARVMGGSRWSNQSETWAQIWNSETS